jgi:hypothetical protein
MDDLQYLSVLNYLEHLEDHKVFEIIKILEKRKFKLHVMNHFFLHQKGKDRLDIIMYVLNSIVKKTISLGSNGFNFITKNDYYIEINWRNGNVVVEYADLDYTRVMIPLYKTKYNSERFIDISFEILASICSLPNKQ